MALSGKDWPARGGAGGMSIDYRTATAADAEALAELGAHTFTDTFGHLYQPDDLAIFLQNHSPENWDKELNDPAFEVRVGRKRRDSWSAM